MSTGGLQQDGNENLLMTDLMDFMLEDDGYLKVAMDGVAVPRGVSIIAKKGVPFLFIRADALERMAKEQEALALIALMNHVGRAYTKAPDVIVPWNVKDLPQRLRDALGRLGGVHVIEITTKEDCKRFLGEIFDFYFD